FIKIPSWRETKDDLGKDGKQLVEICDLEEETVRLDFSEPERNLDAKIQMDFDEIASTSPSPSKFSFLLQTSLTLTATQPELLRIFNEDYYLLSSLKATRSEDRSITTMVFSQFNKMLDLVETALDANGFARKYVRYHGKMPQKARNESVRRLFNDPEVTVILLTLKCGGMGLNLTAASMCVVGWEEEIGMAPLSM
ncbi:P-loop containing nucleoside triphosphate hydrolase protein, partial [Blyttiomyces helicus]